MTFIDLTRAYHYFGWTQARTAVFARFALLAILHVAALGYMYQFEYGTFQISLALLTWVLLNCLWLLILRRPAMAAALSLAMIAALTLLSQFKFDVQWTTVSFFDFMIIDRETTSFLFGVFPQLRAQLTIAAIVAVPILILIWRHDPIRIRPRLSAFAGTASICGVAILSFSVPEEPWEPFQGVNHISNFARSGVTSITELVTHGVLDSDSSVVNGPVFALDEACHAPARRPHIIMVLDESSFDITTAPGIKVPPDYKRHFQSFDGKVRSLVVESTGGPTWYAEYNVLTGLSARSFGRFKFHITRIAADRVERGLPKTLRRCGYKTMTLYPALGSFLNARGFQQTTGVANFIDRDQMKAGEVEPDRFYFDQALTVLRRERGQQPLFLFVYVTANHFPWDAAYRPDLTPGWSGFGNTAEVDEYIRRQTMSAHDYSEFVARLKREFPDKQFLLVRFGDHQPAISPKLLEPKLDDKAIGLRIMNYDARFFTTYYAINTINFTPADLSAARDTLEAAYLPLVILQAAGLPLDATYIEQKKILNRCGGYFYSCANGAEARRFNRLLIDAGLIKGL
ncbi:MAG: sulfatase-like hydrolase/transferase [Rhizobiales bacterium]|nr:sulfatase-like hydrolase/transferase [Hyphomicrobiales bacterium]